MIVVNGGNGMWVMIVENILGVSSEPNDSGRMR